MTTPTTPTEKCSLCNATETLCRDIKRVQRRAIQRRGFTPPLPICGTCFGRFLLGHTGPKGAEESFKLKTILHQLRQRIDRMEYRECLAAFRDVDKIEQLAKDAEQNFAHFRALAQEWGAVVAEIASQVTKTKFAIGCKFRSTYEECRRFANKYCSKPEIRKLIFERDGYKCRLCGAIENLSIDHATPVAKGGSNDLDNLQTLCLSCNCSKGATVLSYGDMVNSNL